MKKALFFIFIIVSQLFFSQSDCITAISVCGNSNINYTPSGIGNIRENLGGCLSDGEHHSVWYKFTIATSGTLTFDLVPTGSVDYDWAIYGPNTSCSSLGYPIRCNAAGTYGSTGMNMTSTITSGAGGSLTPYCQYMNVTAGQTYYLYIDNWSSTVYTFNLTWGGTATLADPFTDPSTHPNPFVPPGNPAANPNNPREIYICSSNQIFDFSTLTSGILNSNSNFNLTYHYNANDAITGANPISSPINVNTTSTYYYSISYTGSNFGNGCRQTGSFKFVNKANSVTITSPTTQICPGRTTTLTSSLPTGNTWSTGETTQSITVSSAGVYSVTNFNGTCSSTATLNITQTTDPDIQISGNLSYCEGSSTTLTASGTGTGLTYLWSTGASTNSINVSTPGVYTVTATTPNGCTFTKSVTITENPLPVTQNTTITVCSDSNTYLFDLTAVQNQISTTPGVTFDYYTNLADAAAGNTNTVPTPNNYTSGSTTLYVRVKTASCSKVAELQLTVNTKPAPTITASSNLVCNNTPVTLTSNLPTGNTWSTGQTTPSITITTPGTYTLTNNNGSCSSDPVSITINGGTDPNTQITGNLSFCEGGSTILTASTATTGNIFTWSNGTSGSSITVTTAGTYTVTTTTPSGCQFQSSVNVTMETPINIIIATPIEINCNNTQITLNASASTYPAGSTFLWTTVGGNIVSGANTLTPVVNAGGTYTLTITSGSTLRCSKQSSITVIKNTTPPTITVSAPTLSICQGDSVALTATGANTYTWTGLPGNGNTQIVTPTTTTTYTVTGIGSNGCSATSSATITITVVPNITTTLPNVEICKGETAVLDAGPGANFTYIWSTGETTQTISTTIEGDYFVIINNGSCSKTVNVTVSYIKTPEITEITYQNKTLTIKVNNPNNYQLEFSIDNGLTWQSSNVFTNIYKNTNYPIRVRKRGENCDTSINYYTFQMSNVITPNSDGVNDVIDFSELSKYGNFEGSIFDKYGKVVFKASSKNPIWDGKYIGRPLPTDTYWYKMTWEDFITKKPAVITGWVLLKNRD